MEPERKQAILVVGEMGQGKSSFVKMMVPEELRETIGIGEGGISKTIEIKEYPLRDQIKQQLGLQPYQNISVIDTPGLDTKSQTYLTMMKIGGFILQNKLEVIAILYFVKPTKRIFNEDGQSHYLYFHKMLELPRQLKDSISYFVFSQYDGFYTKSKTVEKYRKSLQGIFQQNGIAFWNIIPWISQPADDKQEYESILSEQCDERLLTFYKQQWILLGEAMRKGIQMWQSYNFQDIIYCYKKYEQKQAKQLLSLNSIEQYSQKDIQLTFQFNQDPEASIIGSIIGGIASGLTTFGACIAAQAVTLTAEAAGALSVVGTGWSIGGTTVAASGLAAQAGFLSTVLGGVTLGTTTGLALAATGGVAAVGLIGFGIYKLFTRKKTQIKPSQLREQQMQELILQILQIRAQAYLFKIIKNELIKRQGNSLFVKKDKFIDSVQAQNQQKKKIKIQDKGSEWVLNPNFGKVTLTFKVKIPSQKFLLEMTNRLRQQVYYPSS